MITVPSQIVRDQLQKAIDYLRADLQTNVKEDTYLYRLLKESSFASDTDNYDFFDILQYALLGSARDNRLLEINFGYNPDQEKKPQVFVYTESEQYGLNEIGQGKRQGIGGITGQSLYPDTLTRFQANVGIGIDTFNVTECEMLYELIKCIGIFLTPVFEFSSLRNLRISGNDVEMLAAEKFEGYRKMLIFSFDIEYAVPEFLGQQLITGIHAQGKLTGTTEI